MKLLKTTVKILLLAALGFAISGCAIVDESRAKDDGLDRMPWNKQAGWENQSVGMPF
tara:strand:+ start:401 stop:571 length:171 start_codon:yes stop_codon:yes gene_type:complete